MADSKVARRYAKSLLDQGMEKNITEVLNNDMKLVLSSIKANRQLGAMFKSPVIHGFKKDAVVKEIFSGKLQETTLDFIRLIISKNREFFMDDIAKAYIQLYKELNNVHVAYVTTANAIDPKLREEMIGIVKNATGGTIELHEIVDPAIIGGFILRWGDNQIDSSVTNKLVTLKKEFNTTFIQK
jgi:F-type H+-transporting ATPase subunit delta